MRLLGDRSRPGERVQVPESVQALIAARLDTLPADRKSLLQHAAVLGKVFWAGALAEMGDRDKHEVELALHELARKELVRPARTSSFRSSRNNATRQCCSYSACDCSGCRIAARAGGERAGPDQLVRRPLVF